MILDRFYKVVAERACLPKRDCVRIISAYHLVLEEMASKNGSAAVDQLRSSIGMAVNMLEEQRQSLEDE